jgi:hypothetical protein
MNSGRTSGTLEPREAWGRTWVSRARSTDHRSPSSTLTRVVNWAFATSAPAGPYALKTNGNDESRARLLAAVR